VARKRNGINHASGVSAVANPIHDERTMRCS